MFEFSPPEAATRRTAAAIAIAILATAFTGCGGDEDTSRVTTRTAAVSRDIEAAGPDSPDGATLRIWNALKSAQTVVRAREQDVIATFKPWSETVTAAMDATEWQPVFTAHNGTLPILDKLMAALSERPGHALKLENSGYQELAEAIDEFNKTVEAESEQERKLDSLPGWKPVSELADRQDKPTSAEVDALDESVWKLDEAGFAALIEGAGQLSQTRKRNAEVRARVECLATLAWLKYAMDMRFRIVAAPFLAQRNPETAHRQFTSELVESYKSFVAEPDDTLKRLEPAHPYYRMTMEGLAAYREMAAQGPFPSVNIQRKFNPGTRSSVIEGVKKRLAREGYFNGEINNHFDPELRAAVERYQATHGFNVTGILEPSHGKSLNVPIERRIEQIELSLQRWRESEIRDGGDLYVRVNIPEFKMEVWQGTDRKFKNRVVVGNNNWDKDPTAKVEGRINRTKIFSAEIRDIVLNPRWNVPMRIRQVELEMDLLAQPDYLLKNNYVVEMLPDGREIVYQKSGDGNALGRIKFNFPNKYGIFMHDTNLKKFFNNEIRAFSHGCVRLDDPLPVAKYFISVASDVPEAEVDRELKKEDPDPRSIKLNRSVPIYIEYNSVGPDDDGTMMFFSDVYSYDRDYFNGKIPYSTEELELLRRKITQPD